jgi:sulfatase modifying factor 1
VEPRQLAGAVALAVAPVRSARRARGRGRGIAGLALAAVAISAVTIGAVGCDASALASGPAEPVRQRATGVASTEPRRSRIPAGMVAIPGGVVRVGSERGTALELPTFTARVAPFALDVDEVTVSRFAAFVRATGATTTAERLGGGSVLRIDRGVWEIVPGATWRSPRGPEGGAALPDYPVSQVSWQDADAFCRWTGGRLPTEIEWEHAARNARDDRGDLPWDGDLESGGRWRGNVWQGPFPEANSLADGHLFTAPVGSFGRTALGLSDLIGNVWEWTGSWLVPYAERERALTPGVGSQRVLRGGSFLCERAVCHGHRVSARIGATPDSALMHVGFRCAR